MAPTVQTAQATGTRLEFKDRLRAYRFAAELRLAGEPGFSVLHTEEHVILNLLGSKPTEAGMAQLQQASGAVVTPLVVVTPAPPRKR